MSQDEVSRPRPKYSRFDRRGSAPEDGDLEIRSAAIGRRAFLRAAAQGAAAIGLLGVTGFDTRRNRNRGIIQSSREDFVYHNGLTADAYWPDAGGPFPAVVMFPGTDQTKDSQRPIAQSMFVANGYFCMLANYRQGGGVSMDEQYADACAALDYMASRFPGLIDTRRIGAFGTSRGGIQSERMAVEARAPVLAAVSWSGSTNPNAQNVGRMSVPLWIAHGKQDVIIKYSISVAVKDAYVADARTGVLYPKSTSKHGLALQAFSDVKSRTTGWMDQYVK